jgi:tetratricopeptide (TPR) repeat protein
MGAGISREPRLRLWILASLAAAGTAAAAPLDDGIAQYKQRRYLQAEAVLERVVAADPASAAAHYYLGMSILRAGGPAALDGARGWLGKAAKLNPGNPTYLAEYAGVCLLLADRDSSFTLALEGRDAMTRAIAGNPADLEAREGLMRFYAKAPWPLGDGDKALDQAAEIARQDPRRGLAAYRTLAILLEKEGRHTAALSAQQAAQSLAAGPAH